MTRATRKCRYCGSAFNPRGPALTCSGTDCRALAKKARDNPPAAALKRKKWRSDNVERIRAQARARHAANPCSAREKAKRRRAKHGTILNELARQWRLRNPDKVKEGQRKSRESRKHDEVYKKKARARTIAYHRAHKYDLTYRAKRKEHVTAWKRDNPEKVATSGHRTYVKRNEFANAFAAAVGAKPASSSDTKTVTAYRRQFELLTQEI